MEKRRRVIAYIVKKNSIPLISYILFFSCKTMIKWNFLGAAIVAIIYTIYILMNHQSMPSKTTFIIALVILNALTIILMAFAFK